MAGFTLVELLVVLTIILLVSIAVLPPISSAISHRQVSEGARILQSSLAGARDQAIRDNAPAGIRLIPDPAFPLSRLPSGQLDPSVPVVYNSIVSLGMPPSYTEGMVSIYPSYAYSSTVTMGLPILVLEESPGYWQAIVPPPQTGPKYIFLPNSPVSWSWNVRVGDRVQINNAGPYYTIVGPNIIGFTDNQQLFVNHGNPGATPLISRTLTSPDGLQSITASVECLILVNGKDDNGNGWIDEGWDGVDNNGDGTIDEAAEWEAEAWSPPLATANTVNTTYAIERRPSQLRSQPEVALPSNVVVDASRSRLPINKFTGFADIILNPDGSVRPATFYSSSASIGLSGSFVHCWLGERADVGIVPLGEYKLLTVFKTGQVTVIDSPPVNDPFTAAQQGAR